MKCTPIHLTVCLVLLTIPFATHGFFMNGGQTDEHGDLFTRLLSTVSSKPTADRLEIICDFLSLEDRLLDQSTSDEPPLDFNPTNNLLLREKIRSVGKQFGCDSLKVDKRSDTTSDAITSREDRQNELRSEAFMSKATISMPLRDFLDAIFGSRQQADLHSEGTSAFFKRRNVRPTSFLGPYNRAPWRKFLSKKKNKE